jgi:hypothetical protein
MESLADATYPCPASLCGGAAMLLADQAKLEEIKNRIFGDVRLQAEAAVIKIMNGTETPDLAAQFGSYLESQGISGEKIIIDEQAGGNFYDNTLVVNFNEKDITSSQVADWLSLAETLIKTPSELTATELQQFDDATADVVVVLGSDVVLPGHSDADVLRPGYNDYYDPGTDTGDDYVPEDTPTPEPDRNAHAGASDRDPDSDPEPTPDPVPTETPVDHGGARQAGISKTAGGEIHSAVSCWVLGALSPTPEPATHLHEHTHVTREGELATHEGGGAVQLTPHDLQPHVGRGVDGDRRAVRCALSNLALAVGDTRGVVAGLGAGEVELDGGVDAGGLLGLESTGHASHHILDGVRQLLGHISLLLLS